MLASILSSKSARLAEHDLARVVRFLVWTVAEGPEPPHKGALALILHLVVRAKGGRVDAKVEQVAASLRVGKRRALHPKSVDKAIEWLLAPKRSHVWLARTDSKQGAPRKAFSIEPLLKLARDHEARVQRWLEGLDD